jgi:cytochrome c553
MCPCYRLLSVQTKEEKNAEYVGQLTSSQQREIESRLRDALSYLPPEDFEDALENGMDSKIKDLADTIDIEEFFSESWLTEGKCAMCNSPSKFTVSTAVGERSFCCEACYADYMGLPIEEEGYYGLASETYDTVSDIVNVRKLKNGDLEVELALTNGRNQTIVIESEMIESYIPILGGYGAETFEARDNSWCVNHGWIQGSKIGDIIPCSNCDDMNCGDCRCGGCGNCMTSDCCECKNAETFEASVVANKVPKTPVQKAMLNRAMMEKAEIEHTILDLETKARLGLLDEKALMESLAKKFGAEGAEEIATYYQNFKEKHPELHETFVLRVADEDWWYGKSRKNMEEKLDKLGFDFDIVNDYWETIGYDLNPIYETCTDCEGEGIIITRYYPATRDDPADADYETCEMCEGKGKVLDNPLFEAETKKRKTGFRKCSKCGYSDHNSTNCNRLNEYYEYLKHKDEMLKECDDAIQRFTRSAKRYSEDGEYGLAKMLRSDATDMKKLKRMIENNHFGKAVHFAMSMDSDPRDLAPSALWLFSSENEEGSKAFMVAGIAVLSALSFGIYRRLTK